MRNPSLPHKRSAGLRDDAEPWGFVVGRREEGAEKLDKGTLAWAEMEVEGVNNLLWRKAQIRWTVPQRPGSSD